MCERTHSGIHSIVSCPRGFLEKKYEKFQSFEKLNNCNLPMIEILNSFFLNTLGKNTVYYLVSSGEISPRVEKGMGS